MTGLMSLAAIAKSLIGISIYLICLSDQMPQRGGKQSCAVFQYYDENMDSCAQCSELCDHKHVTRTERQCEIWCKDYLTAKTCTDEQYYDIHMESCGPCSELCSASNITRTTDECRDNCKAYLNKTQAPSNSNLDTIAVSAGNAKASNGDQRGETSKVTVTIIVVAVIGACVCGSAIAVAVARRKGACLRDGHGPDYQRANNQNIEMTLSNAIQESDRQSGRLVDD